MQFCIPFVRVDMHIGVVVLIFVLGIQARLNGPCNSGGRAGSTAFALFDYAFVSFCSATFVCLSMFLTFFKFFIRFFL
jgi:hypothetical protein